MSCVERWRDRGEPGRQLVDYDWSATPLGEIASWPSSLIHAVDLMFDSPIPMWLAWGPSLTLLYNDHYIPLLHDKHPDALGARLDDVWSEVWDVVAPLIEGALAGTGTHQSYLPLVVHRDGRDEQAYFSFTYTPLRDLDGMINGIVCSVFEDTDRVLAERDRDANNRELTHSLDVAAVELAAQKVAFEHQVVVERELAHRLKNSFAMMSAIVTQSARYIENSADLAVAVNARLQALSAAQDALIAGGQDAMDLQSIIENTLAPHINSKSGIIEITGPELKLDARRGMGVALAVYELATNALKHGALSTASGKVALSWQVNAEIVDLRWREIGGPVVEAPKRIGFGTQLLTRIVPVYFDGRGLLGHSESGVTYKLEGRISS